MDNPGRYLTLRSVSMLRDLVRKWWRAEIGITDSNGRVMSQAWYPVPAGGNDFCRAVRTCKRGAGKCARSIKEMQSRIRRNPREKTPLVHTCHMGLTMISSPIRSPGKKSALLFTCGFSSREPGRTRIARLRGSVFELCGKKTDIAGDRVPVVSREDLARLGDLLEYCADEAAAFESDLMPALDMKPTGSPDAFGEIVALSVPMKETIEQLSRTAGHDTPVVLYGEPETGKKALALALHRAGPRREEPFEILEYSQDQLTMEHRLFGHARTTYEGKTGLLEAAGRGTIYIPAGTWESASIQVKLLRYLNEGSFVPVGGTEPGEAAARLILGMEQPLNEAVVQGIVRRDLAEKLSSNTIVVPPLRDRREDMPQLISMFIRRHRVEGRAELELNPKVLDLLIRYHWPGNAAELEEEIRQLANLAISGRQPGPEMVSARIRQSAGYGIRALNKALRGSKNLKQAVAILERELIHEGLIRTRWNKSLLARQLGISRSNLLAKLAKYNINSPSDPTL